MIKKFIQQLFTADLYIKVYENRFEVKNISNRGQWATAHSKTPFTTDRLLVGKFSIAEPLLRKLIKKVLPKRLVPYSAKVVIHPVQRVEGGLSEVEERIFNELAEGAGAFRVALHTGNELTDTEVVNLLSKA